MTQEVIDVFYELIILTARLMPTYVCLQPKYRNKENIAAVSVYIWTVMVCIRSVFPMSETFTAFFQFTFSAMYFLVILVLFNGGMLEKMFLYVSAWLFTELISALNILVARVLMHFVPLSMETLDFLLLIPGVILLYLYVKFSLKKRIRQIFDTISLGGSTLLLAFPISALLTLSWGRQSVFSAETLLAESEAYDLFFLVLCLGILAIYMILISDILHMIREEQRGNELAFARKLMEQEKQHYNQVLEYRDQIRIIRHDFRHHLHALVNMEKEEQLEYLNTLNEEFNSLSEIMYCENQALNSLLASYHERAKKERIDFEVKLFLPRVLTVDDLTLCIIIGNLLENAFEASRRIKEEQRKVEINGRYVENALIMIVENAYDGNVKTKEGRIVSLKNNGGLGHASIRRLLNHPGDDFDVDYTDDRFVAMVKIADRTIS